MTRDSCKLGFILQYAWICFTQDINVEFALSEGRKDADGYQKCPETSTNCNLWTKNRLPEFASMRSDVLHIYALIS